MKNLQLAKDLAVPVDICTEADAWVGARGLGKTHGTGKLVELLVGAVVNVGENSEFPPRQCRILDALAFLESINRPHADKTRVSFFAGNAVSGRFDTDLSALKKMGLIDSPALGLLAITPAGRAIAKPVLVPQSDAELQDAVKRRLPPRQQRIVEVVLKAHPRPVTREDLAASAGSAISGRFDTDLSFLKGLGALEYPEKGYVQASGNLFVRGV